MELPTQVKVVASLCDIAGLLVGVRGVTGVEVSTRAPQSGREARLLGVPVVALDPGGHLPTRGAHGEDWGLWPGHSEDAVEWSPAFGAALGLCAMDGELGQAGLGAYRDMGCWARMWEAEWGRGCLHPKVWVSGLLMLHPMWVALSYTQCGWWALGLWASHLLTSTFLLPGPAY